MSAFNFSADFLADYNSRNQCPKGELTIDWTHSLTKGLIKAIYFENSRKDLVLNRAPTLSSGVLVNKDGLKQDGTQTISYSRSRLNTGYGTAAFTFKNSGSHAASGKILVTTDSEFQFFRSTNTEQRIDINGTSGPISSTPDIWGGTENNIAIKWDASANKRRLIVGDSFAASNNTAFTTPTATSSGIHLLNRADGARNANGFVRYFLLWDDYLDDDQAREIFDNPYQILKPAVPYTYFYGVTAGVNINLEPAKALTITVNNPVVDITASAQPVNMSAQTTNVTDFVADGSGRLAMRYPAGSNTQFNMDNLTYQGAFRMSYTDATCSTKYSKGRIGFRAPDGSNGPLGSLFVDGNPVLKALSLAEFQIPETLSSTSETTVGNLPYAPTLQGFVSAYDKIGTNPESNTYTGLIQVIDGQLLVGTYNTYDATGVGAEKMYLYDDATDLAGSNASGWIDITGRDNAISWMSEIPAAKQSTFGGATHVSGNGAGMSINSRFSEGPSFFSSSPGSLTTASTILNATEHMAWGNLNGSMATGDYVRPTGWTQNLYFGDWDSYNEATRLHYLAEMGYASYQAFLDSGDAAARVAEITAAEIANPVSSTLQNDLWTQTSTARYGFIVPGTDTYLVIGSIKGRKYGAGYKQEYYNLDGPVSGGTGSLDAYDRENYYWAFDINDIANAVTSSPSPVRPYDYGIFENNRWFETTSTASVRGIIGGATFDSVNSRLYVAHTTQSGNTAQIVVAVYEVG